MPLGFWPGEFLIVKGNDVGINGRIDIDVSVDIDLKQALPQLLQIIRIRFIV